MLKNVLFLITFCSVILNAEEISSVQNVIVEVAPIQEISFESYKASMNLSQDHVKCGECSFQSKEHEEVYFHLTTLSDKLQKITAKLKTPLPEGVSLKVRMEAPSGAHSMGEQSVTSQKTVDLVRYIPASTAVKMLKVSFIIQVSDQVSPGPLNIPISYQVEDES